MDKSPHTHNQDNARRQNVKFKMHNIVFLEFRFALNNLRLI